MTKYQKITWLGLVAFISLCVTVFLGVTRLNFKAHKAAGIATLVFALAHAATVVSSKMKK